MLILVTHANHLYSDPKQVAKMQPYPPLQALIAAAVLRGSGYEVALFDSTFDRDVASAIDALRPDVVAVCEDNFNFLTKMCLTQNRQFAFEIADAASRYGARAIVNSSDASDNPAVYIHGGFETVISGELESALLDVCSGVRDAPGTAFACPSGAVHYGPPRRPIHDLDTIPPPAWDLLDIRPYRDAWLAAHGHFAMNLVSSRGCPYRCNWCAKPIYGSTYRFVSPERMASEVRRVKDLFAPDRIWFADDIFGLSGKWTREFADAIERLHCRVPFKIQSRCDLMTRDTVAALARAGCDEVWMGAESGSQRVLDAMDKGIRVADIYAARDNLEAHGIRACYFLQFGYLGESWEDVQGTIRLVRETHPHDIGVSVSYPLPNTRFHQIVSSRMNGKSNWSDSGELELMYSGTFRPEFYRALADALHLEVRAPSSRNAVDAAWQRVEELRCVSC